MNIVTRLYYYGYYHPVFRHLIRKLLRLVFSCDLSYPSKKGVIRWGGVIC